MHASIFNPNSQNFQIKVLERPSPNDLVFELKNVDASFANALRRILLAEIATVAIEQVYMWNNSSLLHDEVLAHRLGLVPIMADARLLDAPLTPDEEATDRNTLVFRMKVACQRSEARTEAAARGASQGDEEGAGGGGPMEALAVEDREDDLVAAATEAATTRPYRFPRDRPYTKHVYSRDLEWIPQGDQEDLFSSPPAPVYGDILLAKLRPGQVVEFEAHARVGMGKDHAKFSPVATAAYRLMPKVVLLAPVYDEVAEELVHVYEPGVFRLTPTDPAVDPSHTRVKAVVDNPYACTMSRNFMRHAVLAKAVEITREPNHFIFSVESVGMYSPAVLVAEALRALQKKCQRVSDLVDEALGADQMRMDVG
jgi:DNA-directed RNA polymerase I and III subunit RPAC1